MTDHPYKALPNYAFWRRSVAAPAAKDVDPVVRAKFILKASDKVATGGSCFAQHIARHLAANGFNYYVTERGHPRFAPFAGAYNYGTYSARYGNIYTARQLLQLLQRAYGHFTPVEDTWRASEADFRDAFRPEIQPGGFQSLRELHIDRAAHFSAVRNMVETMDVFVFTLGLTEAWMSNEDGAVFPVCPGVAAGDFSPERHRFVNFSVDNVVADLRQAFDFIKARNPGIRFIVTVSPVPLMATAVDQSVLVSTTLSKAVLRVSAEIISSERPDTAYFPSFEIITGAFNRGAYYAEDLRSVTDEGVAHVMGLFLRHYTANHSGADAVNQDIPTEDHLGLMRRAADIICEEELLDQ